MPSRKTAIAWLCACSIALPAHAITFERLVECCRTDSAVGGPALSPDGHWLATTTSYPPDFEYFPSIHVARVYDSYVFSVRPPTHDGLAMNAAWSPDGRSLAFIAVNYGTPNSLWVLDMIAPGLPGNYRLVTEPNWSNELSWSPDGTSLVFSTGELFRVSAAGGIPSPLGVNGYSPSCGPEGAVVYERHGDLWIVDGDGHERRLTETPTHESEPSWSPDGWWIAFSSNRSGNGDIWIIAASGGTPVQITHTSTEEGSPSWSSGARLVFSSYAGQNDYGIWLATDLPDWTTPVAGVSWGTVKSLYR